ncbi:MAG: PDZ domain-containing protein [Acidobacteriota bacterium]
MMTRQLLITVLALPLALPWSAAGQTSVPPQPPVQPAISSRVITITPSGSYLGIGIQEITAERAKALKLREEAGVEVTRVAPDSPADKAGLKGGDVVLQYNGMKVEGLEQLSRMVRETPVGREVKLDIFRNGAPLTLTARVSEHPSLPAMSEGFSFHMPDVPRVIQGLRSPMLGVEAESIDGQLAQYFGVNEGVLVRTVMKGSPAEKAGVKAGDVILRVDEAKVTSPGDISSRLRVAHGKPVPVAVMREHKEMTMTVDADARAGGRAEPVRMVMFERE